MMVGLRRAVIVAAASVSLGQATDILTNPAAALTDTSCWTTGTIYSDPMQISPRGQQQISAKNCAIACINMAYCEKFSWEADSNPPGNCWLLGNSASIVDANRANVTSGPKDCTGTVVTDGSASSGTGGNAGADSGKAAGNTGNEGSGGTMAAVACGSVALLAAGGVGVYLYTKKRGQEVEELSGDGSSGADA